MRGHVWKDITPMKPGVRNAILRCLGPDCVIPSWGAEYGIMNTVFGFRAYVCKYFLWRCKCYQRVGPSRRDVHVLVVSSKELNRSKVMEKQFIRRKCTLQKSRPEQIAVAQGHY